MENELKSVKVKAMDGQERLSYGNENTNYKLYDFWVWSNSDILSNAPRGVFAEFIVGTAIGLKPKNVRIPWSAYDLVSRSGIKIEVKSASYLQSWNQKKLSAISFTIKQARHWDPDTNMSKDAPKRHADVYVFCLLKHKDKATVDPLKLEQWVFYVLPTIALDNYKRSKISITLKSLEKLTSPITYDVLSKAITQAYKMQKRDKDENF